MVFATRSEGGVVTLIPTQGVAKPLSSMCLIPLWLSALNRPGSLRTREKGGDESDPPQKRGGM